jgi:hypothetical protein
MEIMKSKMKALQKRYGKKEGEDIYNKLEKEGKNVRVKKKPKKNVFK